jgi:uncharacterized protein YcbX
MSEVRVTGLNVHPIKSCGGIEVDEVNIVETGLENDRLFMLIDENNRFISQRNRPNGPMLAQIKPSFGKYEEPIKQSLNGQINVDIKGFGSIEFSRFLPPHHRDEDVLPVGSKRINLDLVEAKIHEDTTLGAIVGEEENEFFSEYLREPVRLIRAVGAHLRQIRQDRQIKGASPYAGFADGFPISLASENSWRELCSHPDIVSEFENGIDINRSRANIEIDGDDFQPYEEDYWRRVKIGKDLSAYVVKPNIRCVIPQTDQETGHVSKSVKTALIDSRKGYERGKNVKGTYFAQNLIHAKRTGIVAVGDSVTVLERAEESNVVLAIN